MNYEFYLSVPTQLAETLLKKETLTYEDVVGLIGPPPFGKKNLIDPADYETSVKVPSSPPPETQDAPPAPA